VQRFGNKVRKGRALAVIAAAALFVALLPRGHVGLDLRMTAAGGHAVLDLGLTSFRIAFDSGRTCPKSDTCHATTDTPPQGTRLARQLRG
jgi:hypothetical protein